jgi:hypothetical protein
VQQARRELHLHALAERQPAHRLVQQRLELEQLGELVQRALVLRGGNGVDLLEDQERIGGRDVPHQLRAVAHEERHPAQEVALPAPWHVTQHRRFSAGGIEQARQHLERRRLSRPVRPEEADHLTGIDAERDAVHREHLAVAALDDGSERGCQSGLAFGDAVDLAEGAHVNDRRIHGGHRLHAETDGE